MSLCLYCAEFQIGFIDSDGYSYITDIHYSKFFKHPKQALIEVQKVIKGEEQKDKKLLTWEVIEAEIIIKNLELNNHHLPQSTEDKFESTRDEESLWSYYVLTAPLGDTSHEYNKNLEYATYNSEILNRDTFINTPSLESTIFSSD